MPLEMQYRLSFALQLLESGAVLTIADPNELIIERESPRGKERGFKLKHHVNDPDAPLSPIKFNLRAAGRGGPLTAYQFDLAARLMRAVEWKAKLSFDVVVGVPTAGEPFAAALARLAGKKTLSLKKEEGVRREVIGIDGFVPEGVRKALLVDDVVTRAESKLEAIAALRKHGVAVTDVLVLIDRQTSAGLGRKAIEKAGCRLHAVFTVNQLLNLYLEKKELSKEVYDTIRAYLG